MAEVFSLVGGRILQAIVDRSYGCQMFFQERQCLLPKRIGNFLPISSSKKEAHSRRNAPLLYQFHSIGT
jgi:hypothetical protein